MNGESSPAPIAHFHEVGMLGVEVATQVAFICLVVLSISQLLVPAITLIKSLRGVLQSKTGHVPSLQ